MLKPVAIPHLERQLADRRNKDEDDEQSQWCDLQQRCLACFAHLYHSAHIPPCRAVQRSMITDNKNEEEAKESERGERVYQEPGSEAAETSLRWQDDRHPIELKRSEECQHVCEVRGQHHREVGVDVRTDLIEGNDNLRANSGNR